MRALTSGGPQIIGGAQVGEAGATGTIYEGYTLSWGDDFNALDLLGPAAPRGKWWTTRTYLAGSRGSDTLLGTMYDTDPLMTGHNDSNRGVPVGYSNMSVSSSVLSLQARKATAGEQTHMSSTRNEVAAMLSGPGAVHWFPAASGTGDIIYEARIKFSASAGNPNGWHPTMWLQSLNPTLAIDSDEFDWEGSKSAAFLNQNVWTGGIVSSATAGLSYTHDGQFHVVAFVLNTTSVRLYIDGTLYATGVWNGNSKSKPQYPLLTSHVYNGTFGGDTYSQAAWDADADGAKLDVDWVRVWRRTGLDHIRPLTSLADVNVAYGASVDIVIPSALTLWGDASVTEYLQAVYNEENEPGVAHSSTYTQFPLGVTYNTGTRTLTVNITSGKTGRINFVMSAWKTGATGEPLRFAVNVGPNLQVAALTFADGEVVSYDLYAQADCGVLTTNGTSRTKTISVTGLTGSGLSYNDSTGLLTGTYVSGSYTASVTVTNSVGQSRTQSIGISTTPASYAYEGWTSDGVGWFDISDAATLTLSGASVNAITNKRTGQGDLTGAGVARTLVSAAQNGRAICSMTRDATGNPARFAAGQTSVLSQSFQGDDKPYTVITVYKPTDANTGYIWGASDSIDASTAQQIALIRRAATASSVRRQQAAATNDVSWGSGQASGAWRIVAVKHTGTAVSVWDTSTTAAVSGTTQNTIAFNTELIFYVGAAETNSGTDPTYSGVACAMDFAEIVVQNTARSDADIQQAITDLATKWGITLS